MEVTHQKRTAQSPAAQPARELIIEFWLERGRPLIDAEFLENVQSKLVERFENPAMSPALLRDFWRMKGPNCDTRKLLNLTCVGVNRV